MVKKLLPVLVIVGAGGLLVMGGMYIFVMVQEEREMAPVLIPMLVLFVLTFVIVSVGVLMSSRKKDEPDKIDIYGGMPIEDLPRAGYTEDLRINSWEEKDKELVTYKDPHSPSERVVVTFEVKDGKITEWYKDTLTDSQLERLRRRRRGQTQE